jgi:CMP-N-acetylneuraminic acid synthetase
MNVVTLMMGRGGSSLTDKNVYPIKGVPLLQWAAAAARGSRHISRFYMSSDSPAILSAAAQAGYASIRRPAELATASALGCDVIRHAMPIMEADGSVDILVMQHANNATVTTQQIDDCVDMLIANPSVSSVVPAHRKPEYHPARGKFLDKDGTLRPVLDGTFSTNRQDLDPCLFFDHTFWVLRGREAIFDPEGQQPWTCMGRKIKAYETDGGLDIHTLEDIDLTIQWLDKHKIPTPNFPETGSGAA